MLLVLSCCALGLVAHACRHQAWLGGILRVIIVISLGVELLTCLGWSGDELSNQPSAGLLSQRQWSLAVTVAVCASTCLSLFWFFRAGLSYLLTIVNQILSGQVVLAAIRRGGILKSFLSERIFSAKSMPHLVALWIYVTTIGVLLGTVDPSSIKVPILPIPIPVPLGQLFTYNGLGLVVLALCGVGIFITRQPLDACKRLGWDKPTWVQVAIGVGLIFFTFAYDYLWSLWTHQAGGDLASQLTHYNSGTFSAGGGLGPSFLLALFTGICAGVGEETLVRGALQPVFGILPAAILHGLLHGQFSHAPIYLLQVSLWSVMMGIVRRYTNTTTTIIGHAGFNFLTVFLFAFNP